jgi:hypothetical protein
VARRPRSGGRNALTTGKVAPTSGQLSGRTKSASLVKILIALDALNRGESTATAVRMLSASDDEIANRLWSAGGGGKLVVEWARRIGLPETHVPEDPNRWGDTRTTAADIATTYRYLPKDPNGPTVLKALDAMTSFGADGFDQRFGIPTSAGDRPWAAKQGWSCCRDGRILHTTGTVGDYLVVVLTSQPEETTWTTASKRVTSIVDALLSGR